MRSPTEIARPWSAIVATACRDSALNAGAAIVVLDVVGAGCTQLHLLFEALVEVRSLVRAHRRFAWRRDRMALGRILRVQIWANLLEPRTDRQARIVTPTQMPGLADLVQPSRSLLYNPDCNVARPRGKASSSRSTPKTRIVSGWIGMIDRIVPHRRRQSVERAQMAPVEIEDVHFARVRTKHGDPPRSTRSPSARLPGSPPA